MSSIPPLPQQLPIWVGYGSFEVIGLGLLAGLVLGLGFFGLLWLQVRLHLDGGRGVWLVPLLMVGRLLAALVGLALLAGQGAGVLLAGSLGMVLARLLVVRRIRAADTGAAP